MALERGQRIGDRYDAAAKARLRRDGRRLARPRRGARPRCRAQVPPRALRPGRLSSSSDSAARRRPPPASSTRTSSGSTTAARTTAATGSRWSTSRGRSLKDLIARGLSRRRVGRDRPPGARRRPLRPRARDHPPRPQAAERAGRPRGPGPGGRLRHRPRRRLGDHRDRLGAGHRPVPLAGAGPGPGDHRRLGPLLGRRDPLRGAHRARSLRRRDRGRGGAEAGLGAAAAAVAAQPDGPALRSTSSSCERWPRTRPNRYALRR